MRKLATIREIFAINPIEGRDRIVQAFVDGWSVIVRKDEYEVGDLCVFCEPDSVMPERPEFEFLRSKDFRIKTMKMAGVLSQGICFPLSILPEGDWKIGDDVTSILGIKQYEKTMDVEKPVEQPKKKYPKWLMRFKWFRKLVLPPPNKTGFPDFIQKTDETRIQNAPFYLDWIVNWVGTEKIDGQSGTFFLTKGGLMKKSDFGVCSRNLRILRDDGSSYWKVANKYKIEQVLRDIIGDCDWVCIQGECVGPGIQKNNYKLEECDLYVFNIIYPSGRLGSLEAKQIAEKHGLKFVPVLSGEYALHGKTVQEVLEMADGITAIGNDPKAKREGIVFRTQDGRYSFKAVSPEYLMAHDE